MPPLILQPLVENAVTHGLRDTERAGVVEVKSSIRGDTLVLSVRDNGVGIREELRTAIVDSDFAAVPDMPRNGRQERGIGLTNVVERLRLHFGTHDICRIESAVETGTTVTLTLPIVGEVEPRRLGGREVLELRDG